VILSLLGPSLVAIHRAADLAVSEGSGKLKQSVFSHNKITHISRIAGRACISVQTPPATSDTQKSATL
jgi:hypothetical protein